MCLRLPFGAHILFSLFQQQNQRHDALQWFRFFLSILFYIVFLHSISLERSFGLTGINQRPTFNILWLIYISIVAQRKSPKLKLLRFEVDHVLKHISFMKRIISAYQKSFFCFHISVTESLNWFQLISTFWIKKIFVHSAWNQIKRKTNRMNEEEIHVFSLRQHYLDWVECVVCVCFPHWGYFVWVTLKPYVEGVRILNTNKTHRTAMRNANPPSSRSNHRNRLLKTRLRVRWLQAVREITVIRDTIILDYTTIKRNFGQKETNFMIATAAAST